MKCDADGLLKLEPRLTNTLDSFITKFRTDNDDVMSVSDRSWITDDDASTHSGLTNVKRIYWPDGTLFEGFLNAAGRPEGQGELRASNGDKYVGHWRDGLLHGFGKYELGQGGVYEGQISENRRNGYGRLVCADGRVYEGQWKDDKPHGGGRFTHETDGIFYRGDWREGKAHGRGSYEGKHWGRYTGQWLQDRKEGAGRVEFANGNSYEGDWVRDMAHGWGRYQWANGDSYEGYFDGDKMHGEGRMISVESGCMYTGGWRQNKKSGTGQIQYADGAVFTGDWLDDMPEGQGTFFNPNGIMFRGMWRKGVFEHKENPWGLPVCLVEGSSYQLQDDLRTTAGPHILIDARVVVPVPPAGDLMVPSMLPRPRKFDESDRLADYMLEESSIFTSPVQPSGNLSAFKTGYVYHSRFGIEYWPHSGQAERYEDKITTHRQREPLESFRTELCHTDKLIEETVPDHTSNLKQVELTVPEFVHIEPPKPLTATSIHHYPSQPEPQVQRYVPVPVEARVQQELLLPKVRVNKTRVDYPVYAPRIIEVPVMVETLNDEGLQLCRDIEEQVAHLEGALRDTRVMSGCEWEILAGGLKASSDRLDETIQAPYFPIDALYSQSFEAVF